MLNIFGENLDYRVLGINELSSDRKRMSIVIEPMSDQNRGAVLYCKGADSVMLNRCIVDEEELAYTMSSLEEFAINGFRTLVLAKKELTAEEAKEFTKKYFVAKNALYDKNKRLEEIANEIEKNMELVGVTAIEDKVHEGVSETINKLMHAGIKIVILTGDKPETAVNIAYSTKLFNESINLITINSNNIQEIEHIMTSALAKYVFPNRKNSDNDKLNSTNIENGTSFEKIISASTIKQKKEKIQFSSISKRKLKSLNIGIVLDGVSLSMILNNSYLQSYFLMLVSLSQSFICGRASPQQKSQLIKLIKNNFDFKPRTLAIGDGANDIPMLKEADASVGIIGKEGFQAPNSSDFAIAKFNLLDKLILYQGR